jgi:uncharacterized protein (DUF1800 family)
MAEATAPRETTVAAALTRIEVKVGETAITVGTILERFGELRTEVVQHRERLGTVESHVQQLQSDARVAAKAVIDAEDTRKTTAALLKEATEATLKEAKAADDKKVLDAKTLVEQSTNAWTKRQIVAVIVGSVVAVIVGVFGIVWAIKTGTPLK